MMRQTVETTKPSKITPPSSKEGAHSGEGMRLLREAFSTFNTATSRLEKSYHDLEARVQSLNRALEEKNRELETNLQETERVRTFLQNILENLSSGVVVLGSGGRIATINDAFLRITGFDTDQAVGRTLWDLGIFDDAFAATLKRILSNPAHGCNCEVQIKQKEGGLVHINLSSSPMKASEAGLSGRVIVLQDIERLKALEEQAQRTGRFSALGEMAARLAHEIRNPLGSIELFASILRRELEGDRKRLADHLIDGVRTLNTILTNLLYFFHGPLDPVCSGLDFNQFVSELTEEMSDLTEKSRVSLRKDLPKESVVISGDPQLLKRLFMNLQLNAVEAMPDGGTIEIAARLMREKVEVLRPHSTDASSGAFLEVRFSDTGPGIPEEIQNRIFDPFFTTGHQGAGLGLAIVHNIMEAHGGTIRLTSGRKAGAVFVMTFPLEGDRSVTGQERDRGVS
jgi:PAS domain S-box-containing protein